MKQVFIVLLSFNSSLVRVVKVSHRTKCSSLIDEPFMVRPTLINLNYVELKTCDRYFLLFSLKYSTLKTIKNAFYFI